jgi:phosphoglycolate phosphatase-like HAD superfamily hydrolase
MAQLLLRGTVLGDVTAVLFDKDGTLSISEPQLITLAEARVFLCLERVPQDLQAELRALLLRAYGLKQASGAGGGSSICPAGITAVASRDHNLIATATALVQVGLGWPEALSLSEEVFAAADRLDARRAKPHPSSRALGGPSISALGLQSQAALAPGDGSSGGRPNSEAATLKSAHPLAGSTGGAPLGVPAGSAADGLPSSRDADPTAASATVLPARGGHAGRRSHTDGGGAEATHLDSAGHPTGGTSRTTEGLIAWLEQLRAAAIPCAVISNDDVAGIEHFLASHGLEPYFAAIWSAEHRPRKPDPAAVHGLCEQLGVNAGDCALIGDANSDLRMALAAGIPPQLALGYTAAWRTPPPLAEPHPRVNHWRELSLA